MTMTANLRASLLMAASMAGFTTNDALVKSLGGAVNAGQIMFVRGAIMMVFLGIFMRLARTPMPVRKALTGAMTLRVTGEILGTVFFLFALFHMPLANVSAVLQALPLAVTLGAALVLRETVGIRRLSAILIGFAGVVIIIRPGLEGFTIYSLSALCTVFFAAMRDLATRRLPHDIPALSVSLLTTIAVSVSGLVMMTFLGGWQPLSFTDIAALGGSAVFLFIGYQCIVLALRGGDIHIVAPFRYASLLWSIILGMTFFGEWPDAFTLTGAAIIVATGLYTLYRERVVSRKATAASISAASPPPARGT
ncbi:DMT family transporter [Oricola nitratireducens]|jgi:drug/metabolite transporter (DMT)-like permease|uniref:DMT family transporter n=1 Tax=Oricola nitratireducens TaxID=2775868 RepID=UPI0018680E62|nr:DMT family transporter [Oricola nitratireducens]